MTGAICEQTVIALGQRGWKRQPVGGAMRSGGEPGMPVSLRFSPLIDGNEFMSPTV